MQLRTNRGRSLVALIGVGVLVLGVTQAANVAMAAAPDARVRCSLATLHGTYTMAAQGVQVSGSSAAPFAFAAMQTFDGKGGTTGVYSASFNGGIVRGQSFTGKYTVRPDCTGTELDDLGGGNHGTYDEFLSPDGTMVTVVETDEGAVMSGVMHRIPVQPRGD
jgi:hypothetical protein